ncbi:MAG TPA: hypothetical protein VH083_11540, partial [Myxococcales bacterium]|nr:hypothetical protein [Myxococcales bacterium]
APVYAAFIGTNEAPTTTAVTNKTGGNGVYVFGIDMVTGQKLWEWNNPYDRETYQSSSPNKYASVGNTPPAGVAVVSRSLDDQVNSVYVGDDEGSLWELDATDGVNNTGYAAPQPAGTGCSDKLGNCNYSLNQAYGYSSDLFSNADVPQPISTIPTVFTIRADTDVQNGVFAKYIGQTMLTYGTGGTDSVAGISLTGSMASAFPKGFSGAIHLFPISLAARDQPKDLLASGTGSAATDHATAKGVVYEAGLTKGDTTHKGFFPQALTDGNRVYGSISVDQQGRLFFGTTTGSVTNIDGRGALSGNIYQIDTATATGSNPMTILTNSGGVGGKVAVGYTASGQATLVISTDKNLLVQAPGSTNLKAPPTGQAPPASGILGWFLRKAGREY